MDLRPIREDEYERLHDDLWVPFSEEMADLDAYNALADYDRKSAIEYRRDQHDHDDHHTVVAVPEGDTFAGYVHAEYRESSPVFARGPICEIQELYVRPAYRRQGLASSLIDRIETWAQDRECDHVSLMVNDRNETAIAAYERNGYEIRRHEMRRSLSDTQS